MKARMIPIFSIVGLVLVACGTGVSADPIDAGRNAFVSQCASCHSVDGTGSDRASTVLGRGEELLVAQVRNPQGEMPTFSTDILSDDELDFIVQYVSSLGEVAGSDHADEHGEAHEEFQASQAEEVHLIAAFEAIEDYMNMDRQAAINHIQQAISLASGEAAEEYAALIDSIEDGKAGNARHELEEMLGMMDH